MLEKLTFHPKREFNYFIIYSFIFGVIAYIIYGFILKCSAYPCKEVYFLNDLNSASSNIANHQEKFHYWEIFWTSIIALIMAIIVSWGINQKILENIINKISNNQWIQNNLPTFVKWSEYLVITKKFNNIDVWNNIFNDVDDATKWVMVTDQELKLKYDGWVYKFSDDVKNNELLLRDVIVYDMDSNEKYRTPALYLTRKNDSMTIEFYRMPTTNHFDRYKEEEDAQR